MPKIVIVGGGAAGCSAAIAARKSGADVILLEKTDMLFGAARRACAMNSNGKLVAAEECKAMGGTEIYEVLESIILHRTPMINQENTYVYNTLLCDPAIRDLLIKKGIKIIFEARVVDVKKDGPFIKEVILADGSSVDGDSFVDAAGTAGGVAICTKYGKGCVMCTYHRCHVFGDRVSIATKAGAPSLYRVRPDGTPGAIGAAILLYKDSLSRELKAELEEKGAMSIPLPKEYVDYSKLEKVGAVRTRQQMEHINLNNIGAGAKCVGLSYFPLNKLRKIPGFERAEIQDPLGGGKFNHVHMVDIAPTDDSLKLLEFENLFCAGEKAGMGGVDIAIFTGYLAGHNAARAATSKKPLVIPKTTVIGDFINLVQGELKSEGVLRTGCSPSQGPFFERIKERGLYTKDKDSIKSRIEKEDLSDIYNMSLF